MLGAGAPGAEAVFERDGEAVRDAVMLQAQRPAAMAALWRSRTGLLRDQIRCRPRFRSGGHRPALIVITDL